MYRNGPVEHRDEKERLSRLSARGSDIISLKSAGLDKAPVYKLRVEIYLDTILGGYFHDL
jgi:hypothetical protein